MEVSFEDSFQDAQIMNRRLSEKEKGDLYQRMKHVVVVIETLLESPIPGEGSSVYGAGVYVDSSGIILTSARLTPDRFKSITFGWLNKMVGNLERGELELLYKEERSGLALLRPKEAIAQAFDYAKLGPEKYLCPGTEVFCVGHPARMDHSFLVGQVAFDCNSDGRCRRVEDLQYGEEDNYEISLGKADTYVTSGRMMNELDEKLCLIQIDNIHGFKGGLRGAPLFDSCGRVVGICSFHKGKMDYAIHPSGLFAFCKKKLPELCGGKKKRKKAGSSSEYREN